eukprot:TRINITY_DN106922_c0_g1_i1.p1 TRINITY_DN106922_c0_g1~~TRINITY_DN106922_c0_g1_i1.p1  ORF type:complete len:389 (+),score=61.53 TRINITY_DN106922_c0_g1_i1:61-1167(+)
MATLTLYPDSHKKPVAFDRSVKPIEVLEGNTTVQHQYSEREGFLQAKKNPFTIVQHSLSKTASDEQYRFPARLGLTSALLEAYNQHHDLVLRPEDIWQAIVTQFSLYVLANSEKLRDQLVDFEGKKQLTVYAQGTLFTTDFGKMAERMVDEQIVKNIKDPSLCSWLLPSFTTTTPTDRVVASVSVMSALQSFFDYKFGLCCGIPSVTLLGTVEDWKDIRKRVDRLVEFGAQTKAWAAMLAPILDEFVRTASGEKNKEFWDRIFHRCGGGSGPSYMCGWVSVFNVFGEKGKWQGDCFEVNPWGIATKSEWPIIDFSDLVCGTVSVPVLIDDNGTEYNAHMFTGHFSFTATPGGKIQPATDWCIAIPKEQ